MLLILCKKKAHALSASSLLNYILYVNKEISKCTSKRNTNTCTCILFQKWIAILNTWLSYKVGGYKIKSIEKPSGLPASQDLITWSSHLLVIHYFCTRMCIHYFCTRICIHYFCTCMCIWDEHSVLTTHHDLQCYDDCKQFWTFINFDWGFHHHFVSTCKFEMVIWTK